MNKILKKSLIKLIVVLIILPAPLYASENNVEGEILEDVEAEILEEELEEEAIKPEFTNINVFINGFDISKWGRVTVHSYVSARDVDKIKIKANLQQYSVGQWKNIKTWTRTHYGRTGGMSGTYYVSKGYLYRVVSRASVYKNGRLVESTVNTSKSKWY